MMQTVGGILVVCLAVLAIARRLDVRLVMTLAGLALGTLGGQTDLIVRTFLDTLTADQFVVPICTSMGFAHVLRATDCDNHLVRLLAAPVRRIRWLLIPGAAAIGCAVNLSIISQASTAVAVGTVLIPLLKAGGVPSTTIGATLLLGTSVGGELLNPGAPELRTVSEKLAVESSLVVRNLAPLLLIQFLVSVGLFWYLNRDREDEVESAGQKHDASGEPVNLVRALVPLLPLALLMLMGPPFNLFEIPRHWLVTDANARSFGNRLIGAAMMLGVVAAGLAVPRSVPQLAKEFFTGAGYALTNVVSLIVAAQCFAKGIDAIGFAKLIGQAVSSHPLVLWLMAAGLAYGFALLCGSGMASTQGLFGFFVSNLSAETLTMYLKLGSVVAIASAAGRTTSPVAAVALMCATLTDSQPLVLVRRVALPLLVGLAVTTAVAAFTY